MEKQRGTLQKVNSPGKERMANLELLRIVSMLLVIVLHFVGKSQSYLDLMKAHMEVWEYVAWAIESLSIVAVNVYMLLSGYLLAGSTFKVKRLAQLWLQILFYSVGIGLLMAAFGFVPNEGMSIYYLAKLFLPVSTEHYWFMTAYVLMYLFLPVIMLGVKNLSKKQFQVVLGLLLFVFCVVKSVVPVSLAVDKQGYDCIWYLCVALLAAYIRLHGIPFFSGIKRSLAVYLTASIGIFSGTMLLRYIWLHTGNDMVGGCFHYNFILVLLAALGFFYLFLHLKIKQGVCSKVICKLAPYTLGVYLWHEHYAIRYEWPEWIQNLLGGATEGVMWFVALLVSVVVVFVIGILLDMLRSLLFACMDKLLMHVGIYKKFKGWLSDLTIG